MGNHNERRGKQANNETLGTPATLWRQEVESGSAPETGLNVINSVVTPAEIGQGHGTLETLFFDTTEGEAWPILTSRKINERGDLAIKTISRLDPATALPADTVLITQNEQQAETFHRAVRVIESVTSHSTLRDFSYEDESAQGARTSTTDDIISPPDAIAASLPPIDAEGVLSATIEKVSKTKSVKRIQTILEAQPTVLTWEYDDRTSLPILIEKKVINHSAVPTTYAAYNTARTTLGLTAQDILEYRSPGKMAKWLSIQIVSKIPSTINPTTVHQTYVATANYSFPNVLNDAYFIDIWAAIVQDGSVISFDLDVGLRLDMIEGYNGPCEARVREYLTTSPSTFLTSNPTLVPTVINPQAHKIEAGIWFADGPSAQVSIKTFEIPSCIHPTMTIGYEGDPLSGGNYLSPVTLPGTTPTTTPTDLVRDITPEKWRFGVYIMRVLEIFHPGDETPDGNTVILIRP